MLPVNSRACLATGFMSGEARLRNIRVVVLLVWAQPIERPRAHNAEDGAIVQRRAGADDIGTKIGNHTLRATGITASLENGGTLERAATLADNSSTRTPQIYFRKSDETTLDEVERVLI